MARRSRKKDRRGSYLPAELDYRRPVRGRVFAVTTYLPRPVAIQARREIYTYPYPKPIQKRGRVIRLPLTRSHVPMVKTKVRIRLPRQLPVVRGSYVSLGRGRLSIHSKRQLERLFHAQEFNRRRYSEYKRNHRKGSHGQLDSRGSRRFGSVAEVYRKGGTVDQIADAALVARALSKSGF